MESLLSAPLLRGVYSFIVVYILSILMTFFLITQVLLSPIRYLIPPLYEKLESHLVTLSVNFEKVLVAIVSGGRNQIYLYMDSSELQSDSTSSISNGVFGNTVPSSTSKITFECPEDLYTLSGNALVISNHIGTADWISLYNFFDHYLHAAPKLRFMMKEQHKSVPVIGTAASLRRMIFLKKDFEKDKQTISESLEQFRELNTDCWILLYPEGTFVTPSTLPILHKVQNYAKVNNLPVLEHVLNPRTKGIELCFHDNHKHMFDYVISVTVAYSKPYDVKIGESFAPTMINFFRNKGENSHDVHVHLRVHSTRKLEETNSNISTWVNEEFYYKEELLRYFRKNGKFPGRRSFLPITARDLLLFVFILILWWTLFYILQSFKIGRFLILLVLIIALSMGSFLIWYDNIHQNELLIPNKNKKED